METRKEQGPRGVPPFRQRLAYLILGAFGGAALMMFTQARALDNLYLKNAHLTMQYEDLRQELDHAQQELYAQVARSSRSALNPTLKTVRVTVGGADAATTLAVTKFVKSSLAFLVGTQVRVFADAPSVITQVLDRKALVVNGQRVGISLRTAVILDETLYVTVDTTTPR